MGFVKVRHPDGRTADITEAEVEFYRSIGFDPVEGAAVVTAGVGGKSVPANDQPPSAATSTEMRLDGILDELRGLRADLARALVPPEEDDALRLDQLVAPMVDELRGLRADLTQRAAPTSEPEDGETAELRGIGQPGSATTTTTPEPSAPTGPVAEATVASRRTERKQS